MQPHLYQLGSNLLLNGDCTDAAQVRQLYDIYQSLGGERIELCLTDPPYGVKLGRTGSKVGALGSPVVYDRNRNLLYEITDGKCAEVSAPALADIENGYVIHNHPSRDGLSQDDIGVANKYKLVSMQAVCSNGIVVKYDSTASKGVVTQENYNQLCRNAERKLLETGFDCQSDEEFERVFFLAPYNFIPGMSYFILEEQSHG